jgi:hypothetical protein
VLALRIWLAIALATSLIVPAAIAETFDHLSVDATPSTYEGPCPVSIKLHSVIKFDVSFNNQEKFVYRWEANGEPLTDDVVTSSKGRSNHVETTVQLQGLVGKSMTVPIRLHASWGTDFSKVEPYSGMAVNNHYSLPANVTVTCR